MITERRKLFESSAPFLFFDYFLIPYEVREPEGPQRAVESQTWGCLSRTAEESTRELYWPQFRTNAATRSPRSHPWGRYEVAGIPIFGHIATEGALPQRVRVERGWSRSEHVVSKDGRPVASVWRHADGSVALPFDPGEILESYWSERYRQAGTSPAKERMRSAALNAYYRIRPLLPRSAQIAARRAFAWTQRRPVFPRWPIETVLSDLCDWMFRVVAGVAGRPVPWIAPWPNGYRWSLVLTHDVETGLGVARIDALREIERKHGLTSSWNFVPRRYPLDGAVQRLEEEGCEVGVHGLHHDGKDLVSIRTLRNRLPAIRRYAEEWNASGFRAPSTQRTWEWMPMLGFEYDSSYSDTDPYEPQPGGCCSYLPFQNGSMVELPITLPQDHTLFAILRHGDARVWAEKIEHIRAHGGMALTLTHPDYADDQRVIDGYRMLLQSLRGDPTVWRALPREVSEWWRRRAASSIEAVGDTWMITGPAADDGRIVVAQGKGSTLRGAARTDERVD